MHSCLIVYPLFPSPLPAQSQETGKELFTFSHKSGVRSVGFAHRDADGDTMILTTQDSTLQQKPTIFIYNVAKDLSEQSSEPIRTLTPDLPDNNNINRALWGAFNETIICCCDDGTIRVWDTSTAQEVAKVMGHDKKVNSITFSKDQTMFISASSDQTAKLWDAKSLQCLKTYKSDRPLNAAAISPIFNQVIVGGGQEARDVTTTSGKAGHFEVDFFHVYYQEYMGHVKGHFGPVNAMDFAPDGKSFVTGGEDGFIRLHHFPESYFQSDYE